MNILVPIGFLSLLHSSVLATPCEVSDWTEWSGCGGGCGLGWRVRNRDVIKSPFPESMGAGKFAIHACPTLYQVHPCTPNVCSLNSTWPEDMLGQEIIALSEAEQSDPVIFDPNNFPKRIDGLSSSSPSTAEFGNLRIENTEEDPSAILLSDETPLGPLLLSSNPESADTPLVEIPGPLTIGGPMELLFPNSSAQQTHLIRNPGSPTTNFQGVIPEIIFTPRRNSSVEVSTVNGSIRVQEAPAPDGEEGKWRPVWALVWIPVAQEENKINQSQMEAKEEQKLLDQLKQLLAEGEYSLYKVNTETEEGEEEEEAREDGEEVVDENITIDDLESVIDGIGELTTIAPDSGHNHSHPGNLKIVQLKEAVSQHQERLMQVKSFLNYNPVWTLVWTLPVNENQVNRTANWLQDLVQEKVQKALNSTQATVIRIQTSTPTTSLSSSSSSSSSSFTIPPLINRRQNLLVDNEQFQAAPVFKSIQEAKSGNDGDGDTTEDTVIIPFNNKPKTNHKGGLPVLTVATANSPSALPSAPAAATVNKVPNLSKSVNALLPPGSNPPKKPPTSTEIVDKAGPTFTTTDDPLIVPRQYFHEDELRSLTMKSNESRHDATVLPSFHPAQILAKASASSSSSSFSSFNMMPRSSIKLSKPKNIAIETDDKADENGSPSMIKLMIPPIRRSSIPSLSPNGPTPPQEESAAAKASLLESEQLIPVVQKKKGVNAHSSLLSTLSSPSTTPKSSTLVTDSDTTATSRYTTVYWEIPTSSSTTPRSTSSTPLTTSSPQTSTTPQTPISSSKPPVTSPVETSTTSSTTSSVPPARIPVQHIPRTLQTSEVIVKIPKIPIGFGPSKPSVVSDVVDDDFGASVNIPKLPPVQTPRRLPTAPAVHHAQLEAAEESAFDPAHSDSTTVVSRSSKTSETLVITEKESTAELATSSTATSPRPSYPKSATTPEYTTLKGVAYKWHFGSPIPVGLITDEPLKKEPTTPPPANLQDVEIEVPDTDVEDDMLVTPKRLTLRPPTSAHPATNVLTDSRLLIDEGGGDFGADLEDNYDEINGVPVNSLIVEGGDQLVLDLGNEEAAGAGDNFVERENDGNSFWNVNDFRLEEGEGLEFTDPQPLAESSSSSSTSALSSSTTSTTSTTKSTGGEEDSDGWFEGDEEDRKQWNQFLAVQPTPPPSTTATRANLDTQQMDEQFKEVPIPWSSASGGSNTLDEVPWIVEEHHSIEEGRRLLQTMENGSPSSAASVRDLAESRQEIAPLQQSTEEFEEDRTGEFAIESILSEPTTTTVTEEEQAEQVILNTEEPEILNTEEPEILNTEEPEIILTSTSATTKTSFEPLPSTTTIEKLDRETNPPPPRKRVLAEKDQPRIWSFGSLPDPSTAAHQAKRSEGHPPRKPTPKEHLHIPKSKSSTSTTTDPPPPLQQRTTTEEWEPVWSNEETNESELDLFNTDGLWKERKRPTNTTGLRSVFAYTKDRRYLWTRPAVTKTTTPRPTTTVTTTFKPTTTTADGWMPVWGVYDDDLDENTSPHGEETTPSLEQVPSQQQHNNNAQQQYNNNPRPSSFSQFVELHKQRLRNRQNGSNRPFYADRPAAAAQTDAILSDAMANLPFGRRRR